MTQVRGKVDVLERMVRAVEKVRVRLERAARALEKAECHYAIVGGNAVAAWVATVDENAVRNTQDVDILVDRIEFARIREALENAGFCHRHSGGLDLFLDGPASGSREAVYIVFAAEKVRPHYVLPAPSTAESVTLSKDMKFVSLEALVRMKLTSFRRKDQVHLLDRIDIGLVNRVSAEGLPSPLAERLRELLDNPDD